MQARDLDRSLVRSSAKGKFAHEAEPTIDGQPKFTVADERKELSELTSDELLEIQRDLLGIEQITRRLSGFGLGNDEFDGSESSAEATRRHPTSSSGGSPTSLLELLDARGQSTGRKLTSQEQTLLDSLDQELQKLPVEDTDIYYEALIRCPEEISPERRLVFLEYDENNPKKAAKRISNYWDFRHEVFGHERCFLPMTLAGAMQKEVLPMAQRSVHQLLPRTDAAGRAILYISFAKRDWAQYSPKQEFMALIYQMELLLQHDALRKKGFVFLFDAQNFRRKHYSLAFSKYIRRFHETRPMTMRSAHICYLMGDWHYMYVVLPIIKAILPKHVRLRVKMHYGTVGELAKSLGDYTLPPECIPVNLGGEVVADAARFLAERLAKEADSTAHPRHDSSSGADVQGIATPGAERPRSDPKVPSHPMIPLPVDTRRIETSVMTGLKNTKRKATKKSQTKRSYNAQNAGDPRMTKALDAKLDSPKMSLSEALMIGGFSFPSNQGTKDNEVMDSDKVSLKQRKNNLCRRIRFERKKAKASVGAVPSNGTDTDTIPAEMSSVINHPEASEGGAKRHRSSSVGSSVLDDVLDMDLDSFDG